MDRSFTKNVLARARFLPSARMPSVGAWWTSHVLSILWLLSLCGTITAQPKGDAGLLKEAALRHRANRESIITWQGRVGVEDATFEPGKTAPATLQTAVATFAWDVPSSQKRWNWKRTPRQASADQVDPLESGMLRDGAYYWLKTDDRSKPASVLVYNSEEPERLIYSPFTAVLNPEYWLMNQGVTLDEFFLVMHDKWGELDKVKNSAYAITREGSVVTFETRMKLDDRNTIVNRVAADLARGGNLVVISTISEDKTHEWRWKHKQVNKVWVPQEVFIEHKQKSPPGSRTRRLTWQENVVNADFEAQTFSLAAMGALPGDVVSDVRSNTRYTITDADVGADTPASAASPASSRWWWLVALAAPALILVVLVAVRRWRASHAT